MALVTTGKGRDAMIAEKRIAVIPAYEPDKRILPLLREATESGFTPLVVDDGSGEKYAPLFQSAQHYAHVISYPVNQGKGHALKTAFSYLLEQGIEGDTIVVLDCDGQHRVCDASSLCDLAERSQGALILGSRRQSGASPLRSRFGNAVTRGIFRAVTGVKIYDTQTGMRAFCARLLPQMLEIPGERYEYEMNMLLTFAEQKIPMIEIPIKTIYIDNNAGSHFHALRDSWRIYKEIIKFSLSSLLAFGVDYSLFSLITFFTNGAFLLPANICARCVSASINYSVNRRFVFHDKSPVRKSMAAYFSLAAAILACNSAILWLLTAKTGISPYLSKLLTELCLAIVSFLVQKRVIFRKRGGISQKAYMISANPHPTAAARSSGDSSI